MTNFKKEKFYRITFIIIFTVLFFTIAIRIYVQHKEDNEIKMYEGEAEAIVTKFKHINLTAYYIDYEYTVDKKKYKGSVSVAKFKCDNGVLGCVGNTFKVSYSTKNPSKSNIHLGKYEKYKRTVEFWTKKQANTFHSNSLVTLSIGVQSGLKASTNGN